MAIVEIEFIAKDEFSGVLGNFGNIMTGLKSTLDLVAGAIETAVTPLIDFGKESILAAARVDELRTVNQILAENAGISSYAVTSAAEAVRHMGIEAGVAESTVAAFIDANLNLAEASNLARVAQDAAVISGSNSSDTLANIIYGIETLNPLILRHAGIVVDTKVAYDEWAAANKTTAADMTTTQKQAALLNAVLDSGKDIAGAYAAAMEEPGKVLRSFPRYFDDIMVAIGEPFQGAFANVVFLFADIAKWIGTAVSEGGVLRPILDDIGYGLDLVTKPLTMIKDLMGSATGESPLDLFALSAQSLVTDDMRSISPIWKDIALTIDGFIGGLKQGTDPLNAFLGTLQVLADNGGPLAGFAEEILKLKGAFDSGGWLGTIDQFVADIIDEIAKKVDEWVAGAGPTKLGEKIVSWLSSIGTGPETTSKALIAAGNLINALADAIGAIPTDKIGAAIDSMIARAISSHKWEATGQAIADSIGKAFTSSDVGIDDKWLIWLLSPPIAALINFLKTDTAAAIGDAITGIVTGLFGGINNEVLKFNEQLKIWIDNLIASVKRWLGISSPSTIFYAIGHDIIQGLINGVSGLASSLLATFRGIISDILNLPGFKQIADFLGVDTSSTGDLGGRGGVDLRSGSTLPSLGNTLSQLGGTLTGTAQVVNNYYGPVYFVGAGEPNTYYDCPSPNPVLGSFAGQLGGV